MSDLALGKGTMVSGIAMLRDGKPFKLLHEDKTGLVKELPDLLQPVGVLRIHARACCARAEFPARVLKGGTAAVSP